MLTRNLIRISVLIIISLSLYSCLPPPELTGHITGTVTDCETNEPIPGASIKLMRSSATFYSDSTGMDGVYLIKSITPREYVVRVSKPSYSPGSENIIVESTKTSEVNICLNGEPVVFFSDSVLNFEFDLTSLSFNISNKGRGELTYSFSASQDWITISPLLGDLTTETDTIRVTINKAGLSATTVYKESIKVISDSGIDTIFVILNGFMYYGQVYKIVKIGTQTWMAENLNVGEYFGCDHWPPYNDDIIEKMCYNEAIINCDIFGGLYEWIEAMGWNRSDTGTIGTVQGICPVGWHIPTEKEYLVLIDYLGGSLIAGGKLKEAGTDNWTSPNTGATNESGFSALPAGYLEDNYLGYSLCNWCFGIDSVATFWTASLAKDWKRDRNGQYWGTSLELKYNSSIAFISYNPDWRLTSYVRCIKNP